MPVWAAVELLQTQLTRTSRCGEFLDKGMRAFLEDVRVAVDVALVEVVL